MAVATAVQVVDSDAHVQEWQETWSDRYLDPAFWARRPVVVGNGERAYWLIDDQNPMCTCMRLEGGDYEVYAEGPILTVEWPLADPITFDVADCSRPQGAPSKYAEQ